LYLAIWPLHLTLSAWAVLSGPDAAQQGQPKSQAEGGSPGFQEHNKGIHIVKIMEIS
jgi:hypothetical protein